jgi:aryl-alcohol dehydrogenase-like predicted oxidoreductase
LLELAERKSCSPAQFALAWVPAKDDNIFAIPGTKSAGHLEENLQALSLDVSADEKRTIDEAFRPGVFAGERYPRTSPFRPE